MITDMKKLYQHGWTFAEALASLALFSLFVCNLLFRVILISDELSIRILFNSAGYVLALLSFAVLYGIRLRKRERTPAASHYPALSYIVLSAVYVLLFLYLILGINQDHLIYDEAAVFSAAREFSAGNYESLKPSAYIGRYPHQLPLVLLMEILMRISASPVFFRAINFLCVLGIYGVMIRMSTAKESAAHQKLSIRLLFAMLPLLIMSLFIYGTIPAFLFSLLSAYMLFSALDTGRKRDFVSAAALLTMAFFCRENTWIAAIAMALICIMEFLVQKKKRLLLAALSLILIPALFANGAKHSYAHRSGMEIGEGIPKAAWVVMGMTDGRTSGWYNGYSDQLYNATGHDSQKTKEQAAVDLIERLYDFKQDPSMMLRYYLEKVVSTWCEPTFQTLAIHQYLPEEDCRTPLLKSLFGGGFIYSLYYEIMHALTTLIYFFSALYPWIRRRCGFRAQRYDLFALVYFLGGFIFHILWETKSIYVLVYVVPLIPVAARSMIMMDEIIKKKIRKA